jgi:hypothetical protein
MAAKSFKAVNAAYLVLQEQLPLSQPKQVGARVAQPNPVQASFLPVHAASPLGPPKAVASEAFVDRLNLISSAPVGMIAGLSRASSRIALSRVSSQANVKSSADLEAEVNNLHLFFLSFFSKGYCVSTANECVVRM